MSNKSRRFMFITAIVLFFILTTGLSLFASGYRLNLRTVGGWRNLLVKTGSLLVETEPRGALVNLTEIHGHYSLLNKKTNEEKKTPLKLNNLLPGEYILDLNLQGYLPYQKKITIEPSITTVITKLILFKNCLPMLVLGTKSNDFNYHPNGRYVALPQEELIFDLNTEKTLLKINPDAKIKWTSATQAISGAKIINLDLGVVSDYTAQLGDVDSALVSGNYLIYSQSGNLNSLEMNTKKIRTLKTKSPTITYEILGNLLIVLSAQDVDTRLEFIDYKNNLLLKETALLKADNWSLEKDKQGLILSDHDHKITYLIDIKTQEVQHLLRDSSQALFSDKGNLIYAHGSEIHLYHLSSQKDYLITRLGTEINNLSLGPAGHLIYTTNQEIGILNLDDPKKETITLFSGTNIGQLSFEKSNNSIFFFAEIGNNQGLYKIEL